MYGSKAIETKPEKPGMLQTFDGKIARFGSRLVMIHSQMKKATARATESTKGAMNSLSLQPLTLP